MAPAPRRYDDRPSTSVRIRRDQFEWLEANAEARLVSRNLLIERALDVVIANPDLLALKTAPGIQTGPIEISDHHPADGASTGRTSPRLPAVGDQFAATDAVGHAETVTPTPLGGSTEVETGEVPRETDVVLTEVLTPEELRGETPPKKAQKAPAKKTKTRPPEEDLTPTPRREP